jgi:hypothetical protein
MSIVQKMAYAQTRMEPSNNGVPAPNPMTQRSTVVGSNAEHGSDLDISDLLTGSDLDIVAHAPHIEHPQPLVEPHFEPDRSLDLMGATTAR